MDSTYPQMNLNEHETYRKGRCLVVVHKRENGEVFYHQQNEDDDIIPFTSFRRCDEAEFDEAIKAEGGELVQS